MASAEHKDRSGRPTVITPRHATLLVISLALLGCSRDDSPTTTAGVGDARRGATLIAEYGCGSCHVIPGIENAHAVTGPPLDGFRDRVYVAGLLVNDVDDLARWIRRPSSVNPGNAMPDVGLSEAEARDVVAYLYAH